MKTQRIYNEDLIELAGSPGFYLIPTAVGLAVNKLGNLIYTDTREVKRTHISRGYLFFWNGVTHHSVHRVMCETFLLKPKEVVSKIIVNHINGIKLNNCIGNLEWCTHLENNIHAVYFGLNTCCHEVTVRNVVTGEEEEHPSISRCSVSLDIPNEAVWTHLTKRERTKLFRGKYLLKYKDEKWPETHEPHYEWVNDRYQPVVLISRKTYQLFVFTSISNASRELNIRPDTLKACLLRASKNDRAGFIGNYVSIYKNEHSNESIAHLVEALQRGSIKKSIIGAVREVVVEDLRTGEIRRLSDLHILAKEEKVTRNNLVTQLRRSENVWKKRLKVTFIDP